MTDDNYLILVREAVENAFDPKALATFFASMEVDDANRIIKDAMGSEDLNSTARQNLIRMRTQIASARLTNLRQDVNEGMMRRGDDSDYIPENEMEPTEELPEELKKQAKRTQKIKKQQKGFVHEPEQTQTKRTARTPEERIQEKRFTVRQEEEQPSKPKKANDGMVSLRTKEAVRVNGIDLPKGHIIKVPEKVSETLLASGRYEQVD